MSAKSAILLLSIVFTAKIISAQPSSSINFAFRLFQNGKSVDKSAFCSEWTILNGYGAFISPCDSNAPGSFYDISTKYFYIHVGAIYPPYIFTLIHHDDSMTIYVPENNYLVSDSLTIHNGTFLFDYSCSDEDKVKSDRFSGISFCPIKNIDWNLQQRKFEKSIFNKKD